MKLAIPNIDTDRCSGRFERPGRHLVTGQDQHPAAPLAANLDGLDPAFHPAVDGDPYVPDALQVHPAAVGLPTAAVTVGGPLDAIEAVGSLEPRVARRPAGLHPSVESGERPVQPAQRRLLGRERPYRHVRPDLPDLLELGRLVPTGPTGPHRRHWLPSAATHPVVPAGRRCTTPGATSGIAPRRCAGEPWDAAGTHRPVAPLHPPGIKGLGPVCDEPNVSRPRKAEEDRP
jgi:hypothetical protein